MVCLHALFKSHDVYFSDLLPCVCITNVCLTYSDNVKGVVAHFSDLGVLVMHQIYQVGWSLWREG